MYQGKTIFKSYTSSCTLLYGKFLFHLRVQGCGSNSLFYNGVEVIRGKTSVGRGGGFSLVIGLKIIVRKEMSKQNSQTHNERVFHITNQNRQTIYRNIFTLA